MILKNVNIAVFLLIVVLGITSWVDINGVFVELPLMVRKLPEGWQLPLYFNTSSQLAGLLALLYSVVKKCLREKVKEWVLIYVLLISCIGSIACIIPFWDQTVFLFGTARSVPLMVLVFIISVMNNTSTVVYFPYIAIFKQEYLTALFIGEGLCALIPGLLGLFQGSGAGSTCVNSTRPIYNATLNSTTVEYALESVPHPLRYSIEEYFAVILTILIVGLICFTILNFSPYCKREMIHKRGQTLKTESKNTMKAERARIEPLEMKELIASKNGNGEVKVPSTENLTTESLTTESLSTPMMVYYAFLNFWTNGMLYGAYMSILPFATLPYNHATFNLATRISTIGQSTGFFIGMFYCVKSTIGNTLLVATGTASLLYLTVLASMSPDPPLEGSTIGIVLSVTAAFFVMTFFSYARLTIGHRLRLRGQHGMYWCGVSKTLGSVCISPLVFVLINIVEVFKTEDEIPCQS